MMFMIQNLLVVVFLILAQCISVDAFSSIQISKTSFRYYSSDLEACITSISSKADVHVHAHVRPVGARPLYLYKDNGRVDGIPPIYTSSVTSNSRKSISTINDIDMELARTRTHNTYAPLAPVKIYTGISKVSRVVASAVTVVRDPIVEDAPPTYEKVKGTTYDTSDYFSRSRKSNLDSQSQTLSLVDIDWLKEHEQIVSEERVQNLLDAIIRWGAYKLPLLVDSQSGAILDGHHRYAVGRILGLSQLPAVLVDYLNDDSISVDVWPDCGCDCLTKEEVIEMSLSDRVYPPKTSKHDFAASSTPIHVPLSKLR